MLKRIITGLILIVIFVVVIYFSATIVYPIGLAVMSAIASFEMTKCIGLHKTRFMAFALVICTAFPLLAWFFKDNDSLLYFIYFASIALYTVVLLASVVFAKQKFDYSIIASEYLGIVYIAVSFGCLTKLKYIAPILFILAYIGPWMTDIMAYFTGRFFGKHKLIPEISPKKTVEGSIGGIVFTALLFALFPVCAKNWFSVKGLPPFYVMAVIGVIVSVIAQVGDLALSVIKRKFGIKDYGFIFPGHGGVLDRFDSVLMTTPIFFILMSIYELATAG